MKKTPALLYGGKTVEEWNAEWRKVPGGLTHVQSDLRHHVGLFRILLGPRVKVLGMATDKRGGLAKRLADFWRRSASGRNHHAGELVHQHLTQLDVEVLVTGADDEARDIAKRLRTVMVDLHKPAWTFLTTPVRSRPTRGRR